MLYEAIKPVAGVALRWYYRSIVVAGHGRVPLTGPVFLAVNHPNAMVDSLVVAWCMPRRVGFTAKSTIFANPLLAAFLRAVGVVPLKRVSDLAKAAAKTADDSAGDSATNDRAPTTDAPVSAPQFDPARNADSFRAVGNALRKGQAIVIFPEGRSHDEPQLVPLRTGLARMALMARETFGVGGIQIIPVGLLFERKEEPRSRVLVQVGEPIDVDAVASANHSVETLTALVAERLAAVTLNFESAEDAARIATVGETMSALLEPTTSLVDGGPSLSAVLAITRRAERVRKMLDGNATPEFREMVSVFESRHELFRKRLAAEHIVVADLFIDVGATPGVRFAVREGLLAALLLPVSWWGRLTHFAPLRIARLLALRNVRNRDEPAMRTIVIGLALVLAAYAVQTVVVAVLFGLWWALLFLLSLIPSASSDMRYGDRARRRTQRMRTYLLFRKQPHVRSELLAEADWLRRQAGAIEQLV